MRRRGPGRTKTRPAPPLRSSRKSSCRRAGRSTPRQNAFGKWIPTPPLAVSPPKVGTPPFAPTTSSMSVGAAVRRASSGMASPRPVAAERRCCPGSRGGGPGSRACAGGMKVSRIGISLSGGGGGKLPAAGTACPHGVARAIGRPHSGGDAAMFLKRAKRSAAAAGAEPGGGAQARSLRRVQTPAGRVSVAGRGESSGAGGCGRRSGGPKRRDQRTRTLQSTPARDRRRLPRIAPDSFHYRLLSSPDPSGTAIPAHSAGHRRLTSEC